MRDISQFSILKKVVFIFLAILILMSSGCAKNAPPVPTVVSGETKISVVQSSYSWRKLGSVDYVGGAEMVKGKTPSNVNRGADIYVYFDYKPQPSKINIQQFQNDRIVEVPMENGIIKAPEEKGIYCYGVSAYWTTEDGMYSKGDTSSVFVIEVR